MGGKLGGGIECAAKTHSEGQQAGALLASNAHDWPFWQQMSLKAGPREIGQGRVPAGHCWSLAKRRGGVEGGAYVASAGTTGATAAAATYDDDDDDEASAGAQATPRSAARILVQNRAFLG